MKSTSAASTPAPTRTLHVINALSGNDDSFIDEWEYSLKSILVNAPLDANLHIHIIADDSAYQVIDERIAKSNIEGTVWRNKFQVTLNNVQHHLPAWKTQLGLALTNATTRAKGWMDNRVTIGGYFRLFASGVIGEYAHFENFQFGDVAVYMDTDAIILANLNNLIIASDDVLRKAEEERSGTNPSASVYTKSGKGGSEENKDQPPLWIWNENSGFIILDLIRFEKVWEFVAKTPYIPNSHWKVKGDQFILERLEEFHPYLAAKIPDQWSTHLGHGFRKYPGKLLEDRRDVGMLHFTGDYAGNFFTDDGVDKFCKRSRACNATDASPGSDLDMIRRSWGLAEYYAKLSWKWAIFQGGKSRLRLAGNGKEGHKLVYAKNDSPQ